MQYMDDEVSATDIVTRRIYHYKCSDEQYDIINKLWVEHYDLAENKC